MKLVSHYSKSVSCQNSKFVEFVSIEVKHTSHDKINSIFEFLVSHYPQNGTFCPEIRDSLFNDDDAGQNKADFRFQRPKLPLIPDFQRNRRNFIFGTFFPPGTQTGTKTGKGLKQPLYVIPNRTKNESYFTQ